MRNLKDYLVRFTDGHDDMYQVLGMKVLKKMLIEDYGSLEGVWMIAEVKYEDTDKLEEEYYG